MQKGPEMNDEDQTIEELARGRGLVVSREELGWSIQENGVQIKFFFERDKLLTFLGCTVDTEEKSIKAQVQPEPNTEQFPLAAERTVEGGEVRKELSNGHSKPEASIDHGKALDNRVKNSASSGYIPEGYYPWFLGGVLIGGVVIIPIAIFMLMGGYSKSVITGYDLNVGSQTVKALAGAVISTVVFLLFQDKRGNIKWAFVIPTIILAGIGAGLSEQWRDFIFIGGIMGFAIWEAFGLIGIVVGRVFRFKERQENGSKETSEQTVVKKKSLSTTATVCLAYSLFWVIFKSTQIRYLKGYTLAEALDFTHPSIPGILFGVCILIIIYSFIANRGKP